MVYRILKMNNTIHASETNQLGRKEKAQAIAGALAKGGLIALIIV